MCNMKALSTICAFRVLNLSQTKYFQLGIEFYLFLMEAGMNDRGSTYKFCNARSAFRNLHVDPLSFILPLETNK